MTALNLTDSHAHLDFPALADDLDGVMSRARAAGVTRVMTVSSTLGDPRKVVGLAESIPGTWAAIGTHPHEASGYTDAHEQELRELASHPRVLAIGEIGLDYHYDHSPRDVQRHVFSRQLRLAREVDLPVVIHGREADEEIASLLEQERAGERGGVMHCFTAGPALARRAVKMGLLISFSGILTFPKATELREIAREVPLDQLLVETDSPFLAPAPHRGRTNEPAFVVETARVLADIHGITLEEMAARTSANFDRVFTPGAKR